MPREFILTFHCKTEPLLTIDGKLLGETPLEWQVLEVDEGTLEVVKPHNQLNLNKRDWLISSSIEREEKP